MDGQAPQSEIGQVARQRSSLFWRMGPATDNGRDPMAGLMQAMSNSPDEATRFFNEKQPNDNAQWVLKDRPVFDTPPPRPPRRRPDPRSHRPRPDGRHHRIIRTTRTRSSSRTPPAHRQAREHSLAVLAKAGDDMHPEFRDDMAKVLVNQGVGQTWAD